MKKRTKPYISLITVVTVFLLIWQTLPVTAFAAEQREQSVTLKVAFPQTEGFSVTSENGKRSGIIVDYLNEISAYTGWKYEYVDVPAAEDLTENFKKGMYDLVGGTYRNAALEEIYGYPKYNIGYSKSVLLARWDDDRIKSYDITTLNGKTIGVYANAKDNVNLLKQYLSFNNLDCRIVEYQYSDFVPANNLYRFLENGDVDMLLGNTGDTNHGFRAVTFYNSQPIYISAHPDATDILEQLSGALEKLYESKPNFAEDTFNANFSGLIASTIKFTEEEQAFIDSGTVVKIAVPHNIHPLFCPSKAEVYHNGILFDLMEKIKEKTGLNYEFVKAENFGHSLRLVQNGEADVVGVYLGDYDSASEKSLAITNSYATVGMSLIRNKTVTYPSENLKVGIIEGRPLPDEIDAEIIEFSNIYDALEAANKGKVDLVYGVSSLIEQAIQEQYFTNLVPVSISENTAAVRFAVNKPANTPLLTVLNKCLNMFSESELATIFNVNNEAIGVYKYSIRDLIYGNPVLFTVIVATVLIAAAVIVFIIIWFRTGKTKMRLQLEKSNAESQAKSEFLSRISHEIRTPMNAVLGLTDLTLMQEDASAQLKESLSKIRSSSRYLLTLLNDILDMSRIDGGMMTIEDKPFSLTKMLDELNSMMFSEAERSGITLTVSNCLAEDKFNGDEIRLKQILANLIANALKFTPSDGAVTVTVKPDDQTEGNVYFDVTDNGMGIAPEHQERIFRAFVQEGTNYTKSQGIGLGLSISQNLVRMMGGNLQVKSMPGEGSTFYFSIPLKTAVCEESEPVPAARENLEGMCLLLAEDNDLNAEIAQDMLERAGASVLRVSDGEQAVLEFSQNAKKYDAILMDIHMPNLNGLAATRKIRALPFERGSSVPIIAMTANSFPKDFDAAEDAGMNYFVPKPIDMELLYSVLKNCR